MPGLEEFTVSSPWNEVASQPETSVLSDDAWAKAEKLVMWFYSQAEKVLGLVGDHEIAARQEALLRRIARFVAKRETGTSVGDISRNCGRGTTAGQRRECLHATPDAKSMQELPLKLPPGILRPDKLQEVES